MSRTGRRRGAGPGVVIIYWRDIPAQITATTADGTTEKVLLDPRFQHAIDRAAHVAGLTESQDYVEQWRREAAPSDGNPTEVAQATAATIRTDYPRDRLEALVAAGGIEPDGGQNQ